MSGATRGETKPGDEDDSSLIELAKRDPHAFEPLYTRYFDAVYGYAVRRLGDPERAADATNQVFLKALAALPNYRAGSSGSFRSWLFVIAHNVVIDAARRMKPDAAWVEALELPDPAPTPEELAIGRDDRRQLAALLELLTPEQREVIELRLAGLTCQEIADQLGQAWRRPRASSGARSPGSSACWKRELPHRSAPTRRRRRIS